LAFLLATRGAQGKACVSLGFGQPAWSERRSAGHPARFCVMLCLKVTNTSIYRLNAGVMQNFVELLNLTTQSKGPP
jgi:hypothetical protein